MKAIVEQILKEIHEKNIVLAEDTNGGIWLLGGHEIVKDDKDRTELIEEIQILSSKTYSNANLGSKIRELIKEFNKKQNALNQLVSEKDH